MRFRCTPLLPQSLTVKDNAPIVLELLACHLLSVTAVTDSVHQSIKMVVARLSNTLNSEMRSCTIDERLSDIQLIVSDFFSWVRTNADQLVRLCRREEIVRSVDRSVRAWLKGEAYASPAELVSVYKQKYRSALTHMGIPLQPFKARDVDQARKDLVRERVVLNKVEYSGGAAVGISTVQERFSKVDDLLGIEPKNGSINTLDSPISTIPIIGAIRREMYKVLAFSFGMDRRCDDLESPPLSRSVAAEHEEGATDDSCSDGDSSDSHYRPPNGSIRFPHKPPLVEEEEELNQSSGEKWKQELLELLCTYTLLAASRTFASGDAFWILSDLYGGEGLALCPVDGPEKQSAESEAGDRHKSQNPSTPSRSRSGTASRAPTFSPSAGPQGREPLITAASIAITASGAKVTLKERYGLYLVRELEACTTDRAHLQPLGRFECTTTTLILLAPEAVLAATQKDQLLSPDHILEGESCGEQTDKVEACRVLHRTLSSNPELICHRAVSIEPYL
eukprot:gene21656-27697_t